MQLTRNNYEEYFLLYIDGELSKTDMFSVEQFVQLHPDLEEELQLLKESMLPMDEMVNMPGKDKLLKQVEWQEEDITPLRQELFLYLDNELPSERKAELEAKLANDFTLSNELTSLNKTKLVAELVEMPSKEELYRSERDRKPIPIRWTRWVAAAAAVVGLGLFSLSVMNKQPVTQPELAGATTTDRPAQVAPKTNEVAVTEEEQTGEAIDQHGETVQYASGDAGANSKTNVITTVLPVTTAAQTTTAKPDERDRLENMSNQLAVVLPSGVEEGKQVDVNKIGTPKVDVDPLANQVVQTNAPIANQQASPYQYASYDDNQDEDPYVNIAGARISKQKLRGVFRTVTRTVTRSFEKSSVTDANNVSSL